MNFPKLISGWRTREAVLFPLSAAPAGEDGGDSDEDVDGVHVDGHCTVRGKEKGEVVDFIC